MRPLVILVALLVGCGTPDSPPAEERAPAPATEATHGGVLVTLGAHTAELVVHESGELHVHLTGDDLDDAGVTVTLVDEDGEPHSVATRWTDAIQGFVGRMDGTPATGEATVLIVQGGHREEATVEVTELLPLPEHEGSVVAVGDHQVEVLVEPDGDAHAYVLDDPDHRLDVDLVLNVGGDDGRLHPIALVWDEESGHYVGHVEGLHPTPGPLEVILDEGGTQRLGRGSLLGVEALTRPDALGHDVPEDFRLELPTLGSEVPAVIVPGEPDEDDAP